MKSRISTKFHRLLFYFYFFSIFGIFFSISPIQTCQKIMKFLCFLFYGLEILSKIFEKSWNRFLKNIDI